MTGWCRCCGVIGPGSLLITDTSAATIVFRGSESAVLETWEVANGECSHLGARSNTLGLPFGSGLSFILFLMGVGCPLLFSLR